MGLQQFPSTQAATSWHSGSPPLQTFPQPLQLSTSSLTEMQEPRQHLSPAEQTVLPCGDGHLPQLSSLNMTSMHCPSQHSSLAKHSGQVGRHTPAPSQAAWSQASTH
jgi:hypothetical protein